MYWYYSFHLQVLLAFGRMMAFFHGKCKDIICTYSSKNTTKIKFYSTENIKHGSNMKNMLQKSVFNRFLITHFKCFYDRILCKYYIMLLYFSVLLEDFISQITHKMDKKIPQKTVHEILNHKKAYLQNIVYQKHHYYPSN